MKSIDDAANREHADEKLAPLADPSDPSNQAAVNQDTVGAVPTPETSPRMALVELPLSSGIRALLVMVVVVAFLAYVAFGTVLARNVTFNRLVDPGALHGIRRFRRETITEVWQTMWERAPDFGTIDLTRGILLVSTVAFFAAFVMIISLVFVPSRREWAAGLGDGQESDTISGD